MSAITRNYLDNLIIIGVLFYTTHNVCYIVSDSFTKGNMSDRRCMDI